MRTTLGILACGLYAWRVYDPKGSYAVFYDVSNWLTGWLLTGDGLAGLLRNLVNLVLLDQAEGFLLGIVFLSLLQVPIWAARKGAGWCWRQYRRWRRRTRHVEEPLLLVPATTERQMAKPARNQSRPPAN
jgi:hypothetical protein